MKRIQSKTWAKTVASLVFILSMTAGIVSVNPVTMLVYEGAYQPGNYESIRQTKEENLALDYTHRVVDLYENEKMGENPNPESIDEILGEPNFFYIIRDTDGKTLDRSKELGDYREQYVYEGTLTHYGATFEIDETYDSQAERQKVIRALEEKYDDVNFETYYDGGFALSATYSEKDITQDVVITGYIRDPLVTDHTSYIYYELAEYSALYDAKDFYLIALSAGVVGAILSLLFLTWGAGRVEDYEGIALHPMDTRLPLEIALLLGFACGVFGMAMIAENIRLQPDLVTVLLLLALMAAAGLGLAMYLTLVRRIKGKCLWECMLVRKLARPIRWCWRKVKGLGRKLGQGLSSLAGKLPLFWKAGLGFLGLCVLEFLTFIVMWDIFFEIGFFLWLLLKIAEGALVVWIVLAMRELQHGAWQLGQGNLDYQVPLEKLHGDFKSHGEQLNSMRSAIQAAVEDQMKSERMKTELITNVSHDIKTPLTSIVNYVDLLKKQEMPTEEAKEYLEVLDRQSAKLKKLTEDLVEAAKATTGTTTVNFQRTDVNVLLAQSAGEYQEKLQSKALQLMLTPAPGNPAISADGRLLWRIFENLLSNIYKYALPGTRVYLTCTEDDNKVAITFRNISETPLNISADELMERFVRGDASRHTEGSGLGLSIARSLTQLQYGTFDIAIDGDLFKATLTFPKIP